MVKGFVKAMYPGNERRVDTLYSTDTAQTISKKVQRKNLSACIIGLPASIHQLLNVTSVAKANLVIIVSALVPSRVVTDDEVAEPVKLEVKSDPGKKPRSLYFEDYFQQFLRLQFCPKIDKEKLVSGISDDEGGDADPLRLIADVINGVNDPQVLLAEDTLTLYCTDLSALSTKLDWNSESSLYKRLESYGVQLERRVQISSGAPLTVPANTYTTSDGEYAANPSINTIVNGGARMRSVFVKDAAEQLLSLDGAIPNHPTMKRSKYKICIMDKNPALYNELMVNSDTLLIICSGGKRLNKLKEFVNVCLSVNCDNTILTSPVFDENIHTLDNIRGVVELCRQRREFILGMYKPHVRVACIAIEDLLGYYALSMGVLQPDSKRMKDPFLSPIESNNAAVGLCLPICGINGIIALESPHWTHMPTILSLLSMLASTPRIYLPNQADKNTVNGCYPSDILLHIVALNQNSALACSLSNLLTKPYEGFFLQEQPDNCQRLPEEPPPDAPATSDMTTNPVQIAYYRTKRIPEHLWRIATRNKTLHNCLTVSRHYFAEGEAALHYFGGEMLLPYFETSGNQGVGANGAPFRLPKSHPFLIYMQGGRQYGLDNEMRIHTQGLKRKMGQSQSEGRKELKAKERAIMKSRNQDADTVVEGGEFKAAFQSDAENDTFYHSEVPKEEEMNMTNLALQGLKQLLGDPVQLNIQSISTQSGENGGFTKPTGNRERDKEEFNTRLPLSSDPEMKSEPCKRRRQGFHTEDSGMNGISGTFDSASIYKRRRQAENNMAIYREQFEQSNRASLLRNAARQNPIIQEIVRKVHQTSIESKVDLLNQKEGGE